MVEYVVSINPNRLEIAVSLTLSGAVAEGEIRLEVPTWVPGDYSFAPRGRDIFEISARANDSGKDLEVTRDGWQAFAVHGGSGDVTVTYRACASEIEYGEGAGIVDSEYAILLGTRYLHSPDYLGPCRVTYVELPEGWKVHHPSGAEREGDSNSWLYPGYEILLDTPVVFGHFDMLHRTIKDTDFYFIFVDRGVGYESTVNRFVDKLAVAVVETHRIFGGEFPFEDYTFIMSLNPAVDWGLEHLSSTMCGIGPNVFVDENEFAVGIRVCAHELFHAWNVRRLRPAPLGELQHQLTSGSFTEGLWLAEGFTRYYEFLISTRAGAYTAVQFFSAVVGYHEHLTAQPAYRRVSATDSSYASYLNHSKYAGRVNNAIDYYDKGMLVAFDLDVALRLRPDELNLDRAMAGFYREFVGINTKPGYTTEDVIAYFNRIAPGEGDAAGEAVTQPEGLKTLERLEAMGFEVVREKRNYLGLVFLNDSQPTIYNLTDDSPAGSSGLAAGDVITQVNGFHYTEPALLWAASQPYSITLNVLRGHRELSFTFDPATRTRAASLIWKGNSEQASAIQEWLGLPEFSPAPGEVFALDFYENFHGIETLV